MLVKRILRAVLLLLSALYIALVLFAVFLSESMIFQPHPSSYRDTAEVLKITTSNGNKISAVYLPNPSAKFTLLVSHGNAEDIGDDRYWLEELRRAGFSVFAFDYEGYGTSQGKATEKSVYQDEAAAYDYLAINLKTPPDHIVIFGRSVGSAPATYIAARRPAAGLILQSPFVSAFRVLTRVPLLPFDKFPNYRTMHVADVLVVGKFIKRQKWEPRQPAESRDKRALQDQPGCGPSCGNVRGRASADGSAKDHNAVGRGLQIDRQIVVGCGFVLIDGCLGGLAFAGAVTLIVISKDAEPCAAQLLQPVAVVTHIFRLAMTHQQGELGSGIVQVDGRDFASIGRSDFQDFGGIPIRGGVRQEDHAV